ncbi:hypothetical protein M378DRAFT_159418 [Amanita muscaria Koide BX008]|uniref:Uncharacterized protein n=1 Tax=Amanita muscaria (strain Koide BX008) TaxID=946122 RepID=A0A0C2X0J0_AMAMK|nr:hypothetical protein M378DRAFT_159418 [Amanita muscaria Koide BX008]
MVLVSASTQFTLDRSRWSHDGLGISCHHSPIDNGATGLVQTANIHHQKKRNRT